jgi:NAD(P)-dependent dehydrogenase (short-subunit alcohol dehydrogenase family)
MSDNDAQMIQIHAPASASVTALVTGCSTGIGRATARELARSGFTVWASARNVESIDDLRHVGCRVVGLDVTDEGSRTRAIARITAESGCIGLLVNNAGYSQPGAIEELPLAAYRAQFETNVFGLVRLCQLVLPGMRAAGSGAIVNLGSGAGLVTPPLSSAYAMSKYALEAFSDSLRFETTRFGIRTILIEASAVNSSFTDTLERFLPSQCEDSPYRVVTQNVLRFARNERDNGISPERVAETIVRAVLSPRPRARYKAGSQAHFAPFARRILGDRLWDLVLTRLVRAE